MKLHLYQLNKTEAFQLCNEVLAQSGFSIHVADEAKGLITASKPAAKETDVLFFNILFSDNMPFASLILITNIFSGTNGTFIAVRGFEESFVESLNEAISAKPSDHALKQQEEDYAAPAQA